MHFHEAMGHVLAAHGVSTIFGVVGDANLFLMDSFGQLPGCTYVSMAGEPGAVMAATGYARACGRLGVASVTHGPGLTNTVTALVDGVRGRTPVLVIAGDTSPLEAWNLQDVPQREVVAATGAGFHEVRAAATVVVDVTAAARRAVAENRPVVLNVPYNLQWDEVADVPAPPALAPPQAVAPDPVALDAAVGIIASAVRPVILAGTGAATMHARDAIVRLGDRIGAPLATTVLAKDLFRGHAHDLGICGTASHPVCAKTIAASDCIIAFGASLNPRTTVSGALFEGKRTVHVDADAAAIDRWCLSSAGIVGDAATVADTIVAWLDAAETKTTAFASEELADELRRYWTGELDERGASAAGTIDHLTALRRIDAAVPKSRSLVMDGGRFVHHAFSLLRVREPQAYVHTTNFGAIGLSMGAAVGVAFAAPDRPVLVVAGDGGFMLGGVNEFNTAVRHGLDVIVVILNDGAYGAEHIQLRNRGLDPAISLFEWPDLGPVATALGGRGSTVRNLDELEDALASIGRRAGPMLIDVKLDPERVSVP